MEHWIFIINISIRSSPWQTFDETIKELSRFKQEYSQAASVLVGDIKTLLMDSQDKYFEATQTVYEWCGVATQLLAAYILLFDEYNEKKASAQKDILIKGNWMTASRS